MSGWFAFAGICFAVVVVLEVRDIGKSLKRLIEIAEDEKLPKPFWGIAETLRDIKFRLPEGRD